MTVTIRNPSTKYPRAALREPAPYGYVYVGAAVDPPGRAPFVRRSARRDKVLAALKAHASRLEALDTVVKATVYRAVLMPPVPGAPRFDAVVLIETTAPETIDGVRDTAEYGQLLDAAGETRVTTLRNVKRMGDVDKNRQGLFLFNHFAADDPEVAAKLWEHLAGWYAAETGLDNSTLLQPIGEAPFTLVNHARWDHGLARFAVHQFTKPSFLTFVRANLRANGTKAMPVLYKLA
ncbi:hypothetical protein [Actinomadura latina]|uniref:Uncharacterized protein n=1 Tax=Actinomadura latina TaxID=163603 RepID=A0A846YVK4_9ACTN|nr:hypothetical protein [Actinomadura latina]NKZ04449.1 hypothetical protein [Actinomadura latina]